MNGTIGCVKNFVMVYPQTLQIRMAKLFDMRRRCSLGQHSATPITNFPGFWLLTKLCLHKSKIAQGMYDQALVLLGHVSVGDQRLHEVLDANAASSSGEARAFVLGAQEAKVQKSAKAAKTAPLGS